MNATNQTLIPSEDVCTMWHSIIHDDYAVIDYFSIVLATIINLLTCPFVIVLNALFITAVRTNRRLQTTHNILLACLAVTDLLVGVCAQPAFITLEIVLLNNGGGLPSLPCRVFNLIQLLVLSFWVVSILHLAIISAERFVAMKYSLRYDSIITKSRLIVAVGCFWFIAAFHFVIRIMNLRVFKFPFVSVLLASFLTIVFCHTYVYFVCRRHMIQIKSEQVSQEATEKFLKEKKAWKTTSVIIGGVLLCYVPGFTIAIVPELFPVVLIHRLKISLRPLVLSFALLNSFLNPLIYWWRSKEIREASLQLLKKPANIGPI